MGKRRDFSVWVAVLFLLLCVLLTHSHPTSWNDTSRLATVEALVHQSTWAIEKTVFFQRTADYILWNGHFYSDKPPVLSFLAAGVYTVLHRGLHVSLDGSAYCDPVSSPCHCFALVCAQQPDWAYYAITLALISLPSALMLVLFYRSTAFFGLSNTLALPLTGVLGLGTMVLPYSLVLNNHIPTAASLMLGFYALLCAKVGKGSIERWLAVAGFATALAFTFDLLVVPFLVCTAGCALLRHRFRAWAFLLGGLIPLALLVALDFSIVGDPLPPSMHPAGFDYPGSPFAATLTGNPPSADALTHGIAMFFGERGLLTLNPAMLLSIAGIWVFLHRRDHLFRHEALAMLTASLTVSLSLIVYTPGFGGLCYGTRWLTDITPVLFFCAAQPALYKSLVRRLIFVVLAILSLVSAWQGALNPWGVSLPLVHLAQYTFSPIGWYLEALPRGTVIYTTPTDINYLPVWPVHAWGTSIHEADVASGVLPAGDPDRLTIYVLEASDQTTASLLEETLCLGQWTPVSAEYAIYRVPPGTQRVHPSQELQGEFGKRIQLFGYDPPPANLYPGDPVRVQLYWRALVPIERPYTAFVHLLGPQNPSTGSTLWAQSDHQPGYASYPTDRWLPGEIVLDTFRFTVPDDAPAGEYTVTTGFYDLVTFQRVGRSDTEDDKMILFSITILPR
jgi:hypothetical protein